MVIYFSGTGNSRFVAECIAQYTKDTLISANEYIKANKPADFTSQTPFIFVSPTYAWRIPRIFSEFIENGAFKGSNGAYFVMTCGDEIGNAGSFIRELCKKKSLQYKGVAGIVMPENYVAMYDVTDKTESELRLAASEKTSKTLSDYILNGASFPSEKVGAVDKLKSRHINPMFYSFFVKAKGFSVTDKCISCGKCEQLCPLNNIKLIDGKPVYSERCTHCMACICGCPTEAIEYKKRTVGKSRYYNTKSPTVGGGK